MSRTVTRFLLFTFLILTVGYPIYVRISSLAWTIDKTLIGNLFPIFGLTAFGLLWLHAISGVFEPWLRKQFDFDRYVHVTSIIIFICIILHPLLLFIQLGSNFLQIFVMGGKYIWLGAIGWLLLITYDVGKYLNKYDFFVRHWKKILLISTLGFLLAFFHSINIGSDLAVGPLRTLWMFYGVTAIISTIYTYGIKRARN